MIVTMSEARATNLDIAMERILGFAQKFDQAHFDLACHAAFPQTLTPDLLYQIWLRFVPQAPWTAVARILLSRLCREVGCELYEMDVAVRNLLLTELKEDERFGKQQLDKLADFYTNYLKQQFGSEEGQEEDLTQPQYWIALASTKSKQLSRELAQAIESRLKQKNWKEMFHLASAIEAIPEALVEFETPLLNYAKGMLSFIIGDLESATEQFSKLSNRERQVEIAGINLSIPNQIPVVIGGTNVNVMLSQPDFQKLTQIVQNLPDFSNVRDRRRLISGAFQGVPQADIMSAGLDLDGSPMAVSVEVVNFLAQFGQVAYGKQALAVFLNYIQPFTGDEDNDFISNLFRKYQLEQPAVPNSGIDHWLGLDTMAEVQEKVFGKDTLFDIYILQVALDAAKAVVNLRLPEKIVATGFMVAPDLLMTNNHVIATQKLAEQTKYIFNYQLDLNGEESPTYIVQALPGGLFYTNSELDYTIVNLKNMPDFGKTLILKNKLMRRDDCLAIIQHTGGYLKKISMLDNFVSFADEKVVQYITITTPCSSGSPVFDDKFQVVAIHHSSGLSLESATKRRYFRNIGTSMIAVLKDLQTNAPEIYARLQK
jgi:V8-like Glu-specific endopeptidase